MTMKNLFQNKYLVLTITLVLGIVIGVVISKSTNQTISTSNNQHIDESADHTSKIIATTRSKMK